MLPPRPRKGERHAGLSLRNVGRAWCFSIRDITAENLDAAILHASNILHTSNQSSSSRQVHSFEVWSGTSRLFPPVRLTSLSATFEGPKVSDCMGAVETAHAMH